MKYLNDRKKRPYRMASLFFGILSLCCLVGLAVYLIGLKRAEDKVDQIRAAYISEGDALESNTEKTTSSAEAGNSDVAKSGSDAGVSEDSREAISKGDKLPVDLSAYGVVFRNIEWELLQKEENIDIYAWIVVPGTVIDYPVVQHPEEMDYYLGHNLDGSTGYPGCIYTQFINSKDWSDRNTVLYGHNMRVGTMFAELHKFEDIDFFEENRYIYIYSEDGRILVYEIFAAYEFGDAHLLTTYDLNTDAGYQQYLDSIMENEETGGCFRREMVLDTEDRIITLSTCVRGKDSKRYLVQGVLIVEGR